MLSAADAAVSELRAAAAVAARTMYSSVTFIYKSNDKPTKSQLKFKDECELRNYLPGTRYLLPWRYRHVPFFSSFFLLFFLLFFSFLFSFLFLFFSYVSTRSIETPPSVKKHYKKV